MQIECILKREGGTKAEIGGLEYHFKPLEDGAHVADVQEKAHIDRFLSISEAYKLYHGDLKTDAVPVAIKPTVLTDPNDMRIAGAPTTATQTFLLGSDIHEATYEIGGELYQLGDVVALAHTKSGLSAEDWNALDPDDRHARIDMALDDLADAAEAAAKPPAPPEGEQPPPVDPAVAERAALAAAYKEKFGKAPHYRLSIENLKAALAAE